VRGVAGVGQRVGVRRQPLVGGPQVVGGAQQFGSFDGGREEGAVGSERIAFQHVLFLHAAKQKKKRY